MRQRLDEIHGHDSSLFHLSLLKDQLAKETADFHAEQAKAKK
jgi:hypothetical protein